MIGQVRWIISSRYIDAGDDHLAIGFYQAFEPLKQSTRSSE